MTSGVVASITSFIILFLYVVVICICLKGIEASDEKSCPTNEASCLEDRDGFNAISLLHALIDDDQNGGLDRSESEEFFREDLKHVGLDQNFHEHDDFITVLDLWKHWHHSEAYNWTVDEVILWLNIYVELPQYALTFMENNVNGKSIPKLAVNFQNYIPLLGIKNPVHRQKISIKSTDLVLFGPPKTPHNFKKDLFVILSLFVGIGGCYFAYRQHKAAQLQMQKVLKDLTSLQNAEDALTQVQNELERAQKQQKVIANDKQNLERHLKDEIRLAKAEAEMLKQQKGGVDTNTELRVLEEELMKVKLTLYEAERRLEENQYVPLFELQIWLQLTYEIEKKYFEAKKEAAQNQLLAAKQMWDKIRKQKNKFLGSFRVAHTSSLDETDQQIMNVRSALDSVKVDLQERTNRWQEIEKLCHFNITSNPGLEVLINIIKSDKLQSYSRLGYLSCDDLADNAKLKNKGGSGTKTLSSTDSLGSLGKDLSPEASKVLFELGSRDVHGTEKVSESTMIKSKSFGDDLKNTMNFECFSSNPKRLTDNQVIHRDDGNCSDTSLAFSDNSEKKKSSKLLKFLVHKKNE